MRRGACAVALPDAQQDQCPTQLYAQALDITLHPSFVMRIHAALLGPVFSMSWASRLRGRPSSLDVGLDVDVAHAPVTPVDAGHGCSGSRSRATLHRAAVAAPSQDKDEPFSQRSFIQMPILES